MFDSSSKVVENTSVRYNEFRHLHGFARKNVIRMPNFITVGTCLYHSKHGLVATAGLRLGISGRSGRLRALSCADA